MNFSASAVTLSNFVTAENLSMSIFSDALTFADTSCYFIQSKKTSNDQELIQSDPTSCPQNQKGFN